MKLTETIRTLITRRIEDLRLEAADHLAQAELLQDEAKLLQAELTPAASKPKPISKSTSAASPGSESRTGAKSRRPWNAKQRKAASRRMKAWWREHKGR